MELIEVIIEVLIGLLCLFCAFQIGINGKIELIHAYHYKNIEPEKINIFTKKMWIGLTIVGLGVISMPAVNLVFKTHLGYWTGMALLILGIIYMLYTVIKYNKTLL